MTIAPFSESEAAASGRFVSPGSSSAPARRKEPRRKQSIAFTLVEVLIATAIISMTVVSLLGSITFCFAMTKHSRESIRATQVIQSKLESIRLCNWAQLNDHYFIPRRFAESYYPRDSDNAGLVYQGRVIILDAPFYEPYGPDLKLVRIVVNWTSGGVERQREMQTLVGRYGAQHYIF